MCESSIKNYLTSLGSDYIIVADLLTGTLSKGDSSIIAVSLVFSFFELKECVCYFNKLFT